MVGQLRIYTINKGMMDSWLKLFHEVIAPKTLEFGMGIQSAWTDEEGLDKWYCTICKAKTGTPVSIKRQDLLDD